MAATMTATMDEASIAPMAPQRELAARRHSYLFGEKIEASLSPLLHRTIYQELGLPWEQRLRDSNNIPHFLQLIKSPHFYGASVTMPNKLAIMPYLDELTEECRAVGACNTIFLRESDGRRIYCGTNTDTVGIRESFYQNVPDPDQTFHDRPAMVIGGGGAARSAVYALHKWMRATKIYLVNRDVDEVNAVITECRESGYGGNLLHVATVEQAASLEAPGAIVACVPNFPPRTPEEKIARAITETMLKKERKGVMLEMCYNPTPYTELLGIANMHGWQVILGTEALIWQGLEQDSYWTGLDVQDLPVSKVHEVIAARLSKMSQL